MAEELDDNPFHKGRQVDSFRVYKCLHCPHAHFILYDGTEIVAELLVSREQLAAAILYLDVAALVVFGSVLQ